MKSVQFAMALVLGMFATAAFADGFKCTGEDSSYSAKLYNKIHAEDGTRNPGAMILSSEQEGTLLVRRGTEIRKHNRKNTVQYVVEGNRKLGADTAILQVEFKQGRETIEAGDTVPGQLILVADGEREVHGLSCERYLKTF